MIFTRETMKEAPRPVGKIVESSIPARLDALPWSRFHTLVIVALGITWVLDGLEVTLAGAVSGALKASPSLQLSDAQVGLSASAYLTGAVLGALLFGWLTDRFGRKRLFFVTLGVYVCATGATALSTDFATFALFRFMTGAGIGGEYSAINSAIQELIPARYRGRTDLGVNGSFWIGAALGAIGSSLLLQPGRLLPDSPRWLLLHGRTEEAESIAIAVERDVRGCATASELLPRLRLKIRARTVSF